MSVGGRGTERVDGSGKAGPFGVILAGGRGTRMGGADKALLELGGGTLLSSAIARLAPQVEAVAINANGDPGRFAACGLPVLPDGIGGFAGPLAGTLAGLDWAAGLGADSVVTVAVDTPFFPRDLAARLQGAAQGMAHPLALAATPGDGAAVKSSRDAGFVRHPTFGLWPTALRGDLREALAGGLRKVVAWTQRHAARDAMFEDAEAFFNVNAPEDLARAQRLAEGAA